MEQYLRVVNRNVPKQAIWVMWYQGIQNAPEIVTCCIESIRMNSNGHSVILISERNLKEYVCLPDFIWVKFNKGSISFAHLSDMIRLNLLYLYGGAWIDSTVLLTDKIPQQYFEKEIFSINFGQKTKDPSHGRWTTFCFFAQKKNELVRRTLEYHYRYWLLNDMPVDYVLFDYFISYIVKNDKRIYNQIKNIEVSNVAVFDLVKKLNDPCAEEIPIGKDTILYKLTWKGKYSRETDKGKNVYGRLVERYLPQ